jgi:PncC family amidohydrolase
MHFFMLYNYRGMPDRLEIILAQLLRNNHLWLAVAESCTGGLLSHRITSIPGASEYFKGGVISYSNEVKMGVLGVTSATLDEFGAVSEQTVLEMAAGVRKVLQADIGLSVSGIAGPGGGTIEKPVGTTWIGLSTADRESAVRFLFSGSRLEIITQAADAVMQLAVDYLEDRFQN